MENIWKILQVLLLATLTIYIHNLANISYQEDDSGPRIRGSLNSDHDSRLVISRHGSS